MNSFKIDFKYFSTSLESFGNKQFLLSFASFDSFISLSISILFSSLCSAPSYFLYSENNLSIFNKESKSKLPSLINCLILMDCSIKKIKNFFMKNKLCKSIFSIEYFCSKNNSIIWKLLTFSFINLNIAIILSDLSFNINSVRISKNIVLWVFNK